MKLKVAVYKIAFQTKTQWFNYNIEKYCSDLRQSLNESNVPLIYSSS